MYRLPPPPRFSLPPPPMLPSNVLNSKILQLTCTTITHQTNSHSFLLTSSSLFLIILLLILLFILIQYLFKLKSSTNHFHHKIISPISRHSSICSHRSYETISSGIYLESVNTSAMTLASNSKHCIYDYYQPISIPPSF